jgi:hypothetical protein
MYKFLEKRLNYNIVRYCIAEFLMPSKEHLIIARMRLNFYLFQHCRNCGNRAHHFAVHPYSVTDFHNSNETHYICDQCYNTGFNKIMRLYFEINTNIFTHRIADLLYYNKEYLQLHQINMWTIYWSAIYSNYDNHQLTLIKQNFKENLQKK